MAKIIVQKYVRTQSVGLQCVGTANRMRKKYTSSFRRSLSFHAPLCPSVKELMLERRQFRIITHKNANTLQNQRLLAGEIQHVCIPGLVELRSAPPESRARR
jgi:hypothetical protein